MTFKLPKHAPGRHMGAGHDYAVGKFKTTIYIEHEQATLLDHLKRKHNVNTSAFIREALEIHLNKWKKSVADNEQVSLLPDRKNE